MYEDDYAKQAAAIGASYAQVLREHHVPPNVLGELPGNQLDVNIDNLFFHLQCGFRLRNPGGQDIVLLPIGRQFQNFDSKRIGHLTSAWCIKPSETLSIDRFDYEGSGTIPWGEFNCRQLCADAGMSWPQFQQDVSAAIETDHRLIVSVLFCRGAVRHHAVPPTPGEWNLAEKLIALGRVPQPAAPPPAPAAAPAALSLDPIPDDWLEPVSGWVLVVNEGSQYPKTLFTLSPGMFDKTFRRTDLTAVAGAVSEELPPGPGEGVDYFSIRPADGSRGSGPLGSVRRPRAEGGGAAPARVVLTADGELLVQVGPLRYATSDDATALQHPGVVVSRPLGYPKKRSEDLTDPFCGRH